MVPLSFNISWRQGGEFIHLQNVNIQDAKYFLHLIILSQISLLFQDLKWVTMLYPIPITFSYIKYINIFNFFCLKICNTIKQNIKIFSKRNYKNKMFSFIAKDKTNFMLYSGDTRLARKTQSDHLLKLISLPSSNLI